MSRVRLNKSKEAKERARAMRSNMSAGETWFWMAVRKDVLGFRIRRQVPIGPYILDFYIPKAKLCIEIDGEQHLASMREDGIRDAYLAKLGILTVRIPSLDIFRTDVDLYSEWIKTVKGICEERSSGEVGS